MAKTGTGVRHENRCHAGLPGRCETKTGDRCRAPKALLTTVEGDVKRYVYCIGHLTKAVGREKMADLFGFKFGSETGSPGRPRRPSAVELLRHKIEEEYGIDGILEPLFNGLTAKKALVVGNGPSAYVDLVPDSELNMRATDRILDRVYGRPRQAMELTGNAGGPVVVDIPTDEERKAHVAQLLAATGVLQSSNGHGNGNGSA